MCRRCTTTACGRQYGRRRSDRRSHGRPRSHANRGGPPRRTRHAVRRARRRVRRSPPATRRSRGSCPMPTPTMPPRPGNSAISPRTICSPAVDPMPDSCSRHCSMPAVIPDDPADPRLVESTEIRLDPAEVQAWLRTLAAIRLVLASRLGIEGPDDHDRGRSALRHLRLARLPPPRPRDGRRRRAERRAAAQGIAKT